MQAQARFVRPWYAQAQPSRLHGTALSARRERIASLWDQDYTVEQIAEAEGIQPSLSRRHGAAEVSTRGRRRRLLSISGGGCRMICPRCRAETRVVSSRPHAEDTTVIVRRRHCTACPHRFETQESTLNAARIRKTNTARCDARRQRRLARMSPDELAAYRRRESLRTQTFQEAKVTGRPLAEIRREWGIGTPPSRQ